MTRDEVDPAVASDDTTGVLVDTCDSRRDIDGGEDLCGRVEDSNVASFYVYYISYYLL